jgi:hypothetical protein
VLKVFFFWTFDCTFTLHIFLYKWACISKHKHAYSEGVLSFASWTTIYITERANQIFALDHGFSCTLRCLYASTSGLHSSLAGHPYVGSTHFYYLHTRPQPISQNNVTPIIYCVAQISAGRGRGTSAGESWKRSPFRRRKDLLCPLCCLYILC